MERDCTWCPWSYWKRRHTFLIVEYFLPVDLTGRGSMWLSLLTTLSWCDRAYVLRHKYNIKHFRDRLMYVPSWSSICDVVVCVGEFDYVFSVLCMYLQYTGECDACFICLCECAERLDYCRIIHLRMFSFLADEYVDILVVVCVGECGYWSDRQQHPLAPIPSRPPRHFHMPPVLHRTPSGQYTIFLFCVVGGISVLTPEIIRR